MKKILSFGIAVSLLAAACAANAIPTIAGPTGQLTLPTAYVGTGINVAVDYINSSSSDTGRGNALPVRVLFGLGKEFEFGAGYTFAKTDFPTPNSETADTWNVNAKWSTPVKFLAANWGLGARYSNGSAKAFEGFDSNQLNSTEVYLVGSRVFIPATCNSTFDLVGHLGVNWAESRFDGSTGNGVRVSFGLDSTIIKNFNLGLEYQTASPIVDQNPLSSIYLRYAFSKDFNAQIAYTNVDPLNGIGGLDKHKFDFGLSYGFGKNVY